MSLSLDRLVKFRSICSWVRQLFSYCFSPYSISALPLNTSSFVSFETSLETKPTSLRFTFRVIKRKLCSKEFQVSCAMYVSAPPKSECVFGASVLSDPTRPAFGHRWPGGRICGQLMVTSSHSALAAVPPCGSIAVCKGRGWWLWVRRTDGYQRTFSPHQIESKMSVTTRTQEEIFNL